MNSLTLVQEFNPILMDLGFYPSKIKDNLIAIADLKNNRELHFRTETKTFQFFKPENFPDRIPDKISKAIDNNNTWFDEFEVVKPTRSIDPFLFGKKDGKRYFICAWDIDEWESI